MRNLIRFAKAKLKRTDQVALESTTNTWPVVEILRPFVAQIVVGNPLKIKAIAEAKIKTDKVDAEVLAQFLRCDFLPSVWQPDDQTRRMRAWITHRTALTTQKTRVKNQIQGLLGRLLIHSPYKLLWTKAGLAWLKDLELPAHERVVLDSQLRQLESVKQEIELLDQHLSERRSAGTEGAVVDDDPRRRLCRGARITCSTRRHHVGSATAIRPRPIWDWLPRPGNPLSIAITGTSPSGETVRRGGC